MNDFDRALATTAAPVAAMFTRDIDSAWTRARDWGDGFDPSARRLLACRWETVPPVDRLIDDLLKAFADIALADWPHWYGQVLVTSDPAMAFERDLDLRVSLPRIEQERAHVLAGWLRKAAARCERHEPPQDATFPREVQAGQLSLVSFPREGVVLLCAASEEPAGDFGLVAAAEWWNRVTRAKVCLLLPNTWRKSAAVNRLATIQLDLTLAPPSALHSFPAPVRVHASPLPGMPHPASAGEQILYHRVRKDAELAVCLSFNQTITVDLDQNFRVDILCRSRRVAFEVDGRDHRTVAKYIADCERDFRLSVQGYVVIRLPEELVQADPEMAMERIRRTLRSRAEV